MNFRPNMDFTAPNDSTHELSSQPQTVPERWTKVPVTSQNTSQPPQFGGVRAQRGFRAQSVKIKHRRLAPPSPFGGGVRAQKGVSGAEC